MKNNNFVEIIRETVSVHKYVLLQGGNMAS